jgi:cytochrome c oxidase assembly protein subunit 15
MAGAFPPSEIFDYEPVWINFFENPALVQFNHRLLG